MKIKKILVSQPQPTGAKSPYQDLTEKYKVAVTFRPFIRVDPILSKEFRSQKVNLADHSAIVFTSKLGIEHYFRLAKELRVTIKEETKYFCINEQIANYLQHFIVLKKRKVFNVNGTVAELIALIGKHPKEKYLLVLPENNNQEIIDQFSAANINHTPAIMYRTVSNDFRPDEEFNYDMLLFFSPQGIAALKKNFPDYDQGETVIGCLGDATAQAAEEAGLRLDIRVPSPKYTSLSVAVDDYIKGNHKRR